MIYRELAALVAQGLVTWHLDVPLGLRPEVSLRHLLDAVEPPALRQQGLTHLHALEQARQAVRAATGDDAILTLPEALLCAARRRPGARRLEWPPP